MDGGQGCVQSVGKETAKMTVTNLNPFLRSILVLLIGGLLSLFKIMQPFRN